MLSLGAATGWASPSIPKLEAPDSPIPITKDQGSWIVAIMVLGYIFGPLPMAWLVDRYGRKVTLLSATVPLTIGWILILVAQSAEVLYVARLLHGFADCIGYCITPMYLGEIASDPIRGALGTLVTVMAKSGILLSYSVGPYVSVRTLPYILLIPCVLFFATFIWLPESPYFLIARKREMVATKSLENLRGHKNVEDELELIKVAVRKAEENRGTFKQLFKDGNRKALIVAVGLVSCQQLCGSQAIIGYSETIFEEVGGIMEARETAILMAVVQVIAALFSSSVVDRLGRRFLLLVSTSGAAVCLFIVGTFFFFKNGNYDTSGLTWLPITAIMLFIVSYTIGIAAVPFAILGEIFPTNIKAYAGAICVMTAALVGATVTKMFQVVTDGMGINYSFWFFALFSFLFIIFVYFLVPETKGKPLHVILEEMNAPFLAKKKKVHYVE